MSRNAVLFLVIALFMSGCLGEDYSVPEDTLLSFFEFYNAGKFNSAAKLTIFDAGTFAMMPYAPLSDIDINEIECDGSFAMVSFSGDVNGNGERIERWASLYNLKGWKILNIGNDYEKLRGDSMDYIKENIEPLKNGEKLEFSFYEGPAEEGFLFLIGEGAHYAQEMIDTEFEFIKYLNQFGYRDVFIERGYASKYLIQKYLDTGDEECYRLLSDEGNFIKRIYELNCELPDDRKIRLWPIDVDDSGSLVHGLYMLNEYLSDESFSKLYWGDECINWRNWGLTDPTELTMVLQEIKNKTEDERVNDIVDSLLASTKINFDTSPTRNENREEKMKENFRQIFEEISKEREVNPIVILGSGHTMKSSQKKSLGFERIGYYLSNEFFETRGKVYSVKIEPLSGSAYVTLIHSSTQTMELSDIDNILMGNNEAVIADIENTLEKEHYDSIIYLKEIHPAERPWDIE